MQTLRQTMKIRLIAMGCILSALSGILIVIKGFETAFLGLLAVGIVVLVVGLLWKSPKNST
jgi:hypothetical protein